MKRILNESEYTAEQLNTITSLAEKCGLCEQTVRILYGRGIDTADKIKKFINPSKEHFLNAFLMSGMKEAVEMITTARDEEWSVVIYGDYDADGVCASTIMYRVLKDFGIEANVYVPERRNGYGLSIESVDCIFEEWFPQLVITVDCGISNAEAVEYIKELGAEVIVTDHHELPDKLPDCICINPKIQDSYPYDNLCGAGVAFKVGCALLGKAAYKYLDFAAIATVADSVPLTGENRDIVAEGLVQINANARANYAGFINKSGERITAQTLAFSVAPKINAAGRMGDADSALCLFLTDDKREIYNYSVKLSAYNLERQKCCDELYYSAKCKIKEKGADGRVIVLCDDGWNSGFVGIVAARLAEEYCRPTLLFVKNGDVLKGSVRSVDGVNIFEALKACSHLILEFGGHSQAAGINIERQNLDKLEQELNAYLHKNYSQQAFIPTYYVNGESSLPLSQKFIKELNLLEPFGVGNRKPLFVLNTSDCSARPVKPMSAHLSVKSGSQDFMYFSGKKNEKLLKSAINKRIVYEYSISTFRGKEQSKGYVKDVIYSPEDIQKATDYISLNLIDLLSGEEVDAIVSPISATEAQKLLDGCTEYGTAFVVYNPETLKNFKLPAIEVNAFALSAAATASVIIVSPQIDCDLSDYEKIIFLDNPSRVTLPSLSGKNISVCKDFDGIKLIKGLDIDREQLLSVYKQLNANGENMEGYDEEELSLLNALSPTPLQTLFAIKVFMQLGLIYFNDGKLCIKRGLKTQLTNSELYNFISTYIN